MKNILVIDDNLDIRENTAEILQLAGFKVFTAENGKQGVDLALKEKPDIIICDIMMPELDGYGVLHLLRKNENTRDIPFIFLTAKAERSDLRKGMDMGADDYIPKPFEDIELLNAVETRLKKKELLEQKYVNGAQGVSQFLSDLRGSGLIGELAEKYELVTYSKKQVLYQEGKMPRHVFYLVNGKVKTSRSHEDGKEYITELCTDGDFIGHNAIIEEKNYEDTAEVMEDAEVLRIPKEDFIKMIYGDISIAAKFIRIAAHNVNEKEERLTNLAYSSLRKRVARALADIHDKFDASKSGGKLVQISREDIAQYIGTATESLIRTLSDFKSEKLIEIKEGKITIPEIGKLRKLAY